MGHIVQFPIRFDRCPTGVECDDRLFQDGCANLRRNPGPWASWWPFASTDTHPNANYYTYFHTVSHTPTYTYTFRHTYTFSYSFTFSYSLPYPDTYRRTHVYSHSYPESHSRGTGHQYLDAHARPDG